MRNKIILFTFIIFILIASSGIGSAWSVTRITTNASEQIDPSIYGNYIVWRDYRNGGSDIYLQNMATHVQTRVTTGIYAIDPCVSGNRIVWSDDRNGNWDIYMYEISTKKTTRITLNTSTQYRPGVYGNNIVWEDARNGRCDVYLQNLTSKKQTNIGNGHSPSIYGTKILFSDDTNMVQIYDIVTKKRIYIGHGGPLSIYGNRILWIDDADNPHVHLYDYVAKKEINLPYYYLANPSLYSNKIVYYNTVKGNTDIYMLTL